MILSYVICAVASYLMGCISSGLLLSHNSGKDIRALGSKTTGATNVSRVLGIKLGVATFIGDFLKGIIAIALADLALGHTGALIAGLFVVIGHNWPVFYQFKGGKGISTSCAVLLYLFPLEAGIGMVAALMIIVLFRYVSVGSLTLLAVTAVLCLFRQPFFPEGAFCLALLALGTWRHKKNIERLLQGTENKFFIKK